MKGATAASRTVAAMIHATPIRRDAEGRYCPNDLHRAAGGAARHQLSNFMQLQPTKELTEVIANSRNSMNKNPVEMSRGRYGGTCAIVSAGTSLSSLLSMAMKVAEEKERLEAELAVARLAHRVLRGGRGHRGYPPPRRGLRRI